ncbi:hypothetical protein GOP47_0005511 [Adiantum capillus-veneris]|uniref:DNA-repair protein Xrcc1 N-terminal domain-containing protein n=1 Tax=Adiantum capillus-veneris TaxID=13818 RepID=A0A9D4ZNB0_ADICA|nr:hypothetical protein GOP47_0005511 [Adiantum capillus-veneris]
MATELELDPRHRILPFKVRAASKEVQPHKAANVLDPDPKNHWSTSTNVKEWLLLELEEPCLLQQIRIHNKSVLEWEISLGLRYKPDLFSKVRTRCEAPRRESQYIANYAPCRYVRLSCLRGNPIAIYSVQLIGISMPGLEPEFQPLVDHLLPLVISTKHELQDLYLQLLGEIMNRLSPFTPVLEGDLAMYSENTESTLRFLAMLSGPFYPILVAIDERERLKNLAPPNDTESSKGAQGSLFTVSSNFQAPPRRSRSPAPSQQSAGQLVAFRSDVALSLLRAAFRDLALGTVCRMVARVFRKISSNYSTVGVIGVRNDVSPGSGQVESGYENVMSNAELSTYGFQQTDYSVIFGEDFFVLEDDLGETGLSSLLDIASVEEGLLHFLYASISKPILCRRLAEMKPDLVPVLPYIQAVLPAIRPASVSILDQVDESFNPWQAPLVQRAFSQVVSLATTVSYRPLLDACAGYLSSFSLAHEKAACILIDLCSGPLAPWLPAVIAKVDLVFELVEGILNSFQVVDKGICFGRAALVYVILGFSGHIDEFLTSYKAVKHKIIFVIEMLEPFLLPAITPIKNTIAFGDVSAVLTEKQERDCSLALDILRAAISKPGFLSALEVEWRKGVVKPSVLISVIAPHLPVPAGVDARGGVSETGDDGIPVQQMRANADSCSKKVLSDNITKAFVTDDEVSSKADFLPAENHEDPFKLFVPPDLKFMNLKLFSSRPQESEDFGQFGMKGDPKPGGCDVKDADFFKTYREDSKILYSDYRHLRNHQERELQAAEFIHFAEGLHSQKDGTLANHEAAINCLLLAAESHLNPLMPRAWQNEQFDRLIPTMTKKLGSRKESSEERLNGLLSLEEERDKMVLQILLKAAEWDAQVRDKGYEDLQELKLYAMDDKSLIENCAIDATTLLRKHQALFLRFLIVQLKRDADYIYEALLQGLLFFLSAATELVCSAEHVVETILRTAEHINIYLLNNVKQKGLKHSTMLSMSCIHRKWSLLCRLVVAASGGKSGEGDDECTHEELVPSSAWMSKLAEFAASPFPLVRFVGWKALARFARCQHQSGVVLASDLQQLSALLSVFADDLMCSDITECGPGVVNFSLKPLDERSSGLSSGGLEQCRSGTMSSLCPEVDFLCPSLQKQFISGALAILDAVCLQLKGVPVTALPDILSWFSELCCHPYVLEQRSDLKLHTKIKGFAAENVRFIILRLLEVLMLEHMEAMVPELPRVFGVVLSLCQSFYCDISLLDSVLKALKPLFSYGLTTAASAELQLEDDCDTVTIESLCADPLMELIQKTPESKNYTSEQKYDGSLLLFLSGAVLCDLSFPKKLQLMHLLRNWANFTAFTETTSYINYLYAFQKIFEACQWILEKALAQEGLLLPYVAKVSEEPVLDKAQLAAAVQTVVDTNCLNLQEVAELHTDDLAHPVRKLRTDEDHNLPTENGGPSVTLSLPESCEFEECTEGIAFALAASLEKVWNLHPQLAEKLTKTVTQCLMVSNYLIKQCSGVSFLAPDEAQEAGEERQSITEERHQDLGSNGAALSKVCQAVSTFQKSHYWHVAVCAMEFFLSQPDSKAIVDILPCICCILQYQCTDAPRISWREISVKWLSKVVERFIPYLSSAQITPLAQLFKVLMEHKEPEQRAGALQELEKLADLDKLDRESIGAVSTSNVLHQHAPLLQEGKFVGDADFVAAIVDAEWDVVCSLAACDSSPRIRKQAIEVLVKFVPFAQPHHLQRLLSSADTLLPGLAKESYTMIDAPITRLSLALLSRACLYSSMKEISMVPSGVWCSLEVLSKPRNGSVLGEIERATCTALLHLRDHEHDAKQLIQDFLSRKSEGQPKRESQFSYVQATVLQVLARLNVARMIENSLCSKSNEEAKKLEEAEIELELLKQKRAHEENNRHQMLQSQTKFETQISHSAVSKTRKEELQRLQIQILSEELVATREEISARLERQRLARHNRQLALEQATLREIELLQELDREKAAEIEREIERQKVLERERARTKELRHSLELEAERRTQRDLQRELDQRESGTIRPSRREFPGSGSGSRPRERYRERDSGRPSQDARSSTGAVRENSTTPPATPTAGSRSTGR